LRPEFTAGNQYDHPRHHPHHAPPPPLELTAKYVSPPPPPLELTEIVLHAAELSTNSLGEFVAFWNYAFHTVSIHRGAFNQFPRGICGVVDFTFPDRSPHSGAFNQFPGGFCNVLEFCFPHGFQHSGDFNHPPCGVLEFLFAQATSLRSKV